jgi:hypothetical protein
LSDRVGHVLDDMFHARINVVATGSNRSPDGMHFIPSKVAALARPGPAGADLQRRGWRQLGQRGLPAVGNSLTSGLNGNQAVVLSVDAGEIRYNLFDALSVDLPMILKLDDKLR